MITLGIGLWLNEFELRGMASYPDRENDIRVSSFGALNQTVKKLRDIICDNNNECELPENACANGGVCQNGISLGYCICPAAYAGLQCQYECASAADVIFLIDGSGSVGKSNYEFLLNFVKNVTLRLDIDSSTSETQGVRVGLVTFSYSYKREFNLNEHMGRLSLLNAIDVPYIGGTTNTAAVLSYTCSGRDMFDTTRGGRAGVRKNIVLFTDGKSNNMTATKEAAKLCHDRGFFVLIVGLTYSTDRTELDTMATYPPDKNVYFFTNFDEMRAQQDNLADLLAGQICNNNDPCASNKCANGATCVALLNDYQCRCTEGWYGFYCNETCREELDLAFALDVSGSTRRERWSLVQDFVINVMRTFNFDGLDRTRVAVVYWDDNAHVAFHFNTHTNIQGLIQGIRDIPFSGGRTHTAAALQLLRTSVFTPGNGDRLTVRNFVIVITDGESNINSNLTLLEATRVRETGAKVMVVPVGGNFANMGEINAIASLPLDRMVHMVERFSELPNILPDIAQAACNDVDECLSNPCQAPGECRDDFQSYYCECPIGRSGQTCQRECNIENTDIVLLLDTSGSTEDDFREMSEFAYDLVYGLDMSADRTRVGVILFNTDSQMLFKLNTYSQKISVLNALRFKYTGGRTSIYSALRLAGADMFTVASGDRPGVRNILVLASDGYSTVNGGDPSTEAQELRNQGIEIYVVAMGSNPNLAELNAISSDPDTSHVINLADSDGMSAAEALLDVLCE
jgi:collagen type VI alpha